MPAEWRQSTWGDEITLEYGKGIRSYSDPIAPFRVFGSNGPIGWTLEPLAPGPGVILGRKGAYRGVRYSPQPFFVIDTAYYVVPKTDLDMRWLYYAIVHQKLGEIDDGSPIPSTTRSAVYVRDVEVPPPTEQRAISSILGALDDKIDQNRQMNETLGAMVRAIFKDWFVDFGPVRAKMEGRAPYLAPALWGLFPERLDDAEKPQSWETRPFGAFLLDNIGGDWGKDASDLDHNQAVSIIRGTDMPDLVDGGVGKVPTRYTTLSKLESRALMAGDIIIEVSGGSHTQPTGRSLLVTKSILDRFSNPVVCASFCRRFRPKSVATSVLLAQHLSFLYSHGGTWEYQNQSTGIANFQTTHFLASEKVMWPGERLCDAFAKQIEPIIRHSTRNESLTLAATRDLLLPKLMAGEIRVREAEKLLRQAAC